MSEEFNAKVLNYQFSIKRFILETNYSFHCIFINKWKAVNHKVMETQISSWKFQCCVYSGNLPTTHHTLYS